MTNTGTVQVSAESALSSHESTHSSLISSPETSPEAVKREELSNSSSRPSSLAMAQDKVHTTSQGVHSHVPVGKPHGSTRKPQVLSPRDSSPEQKVLQTAQIQKVTRILRQRLKLAGYKTQHGWQNLGLDKIESIMADSGDQSPMSSLAGRNSSSTSEDSQKPLNFEDPDINSTSDEDESRYSRRRSGSRGESCPGNQQSDFNEPTSKSNKQLCPPSTPLQRKNSAQFSCTINTPPASRSDADLLMFFSSSPSSVNKRPRSNSSTISNSHFGGGLFQSPSTPQQGFNLGEFLNIVTPSPRPPSSSRGSNFEPSSGMLAAARKRLNFNTTMNSSDTGASSHVAPATF